MSLNDTPSGERLHISFFGKRNAGKSSLVNAITGQEMSIVSEVKGTTTDPVKKAMELLPLGPVVIIDTPGLDDEGILGEKRIKKAKEIMESTDVAVIVVDGHIGISHEEDEVARLLQARDIPFLYAFTKSDLGGFPMPHAMNYIAVSSATGENINELKELIGKVGAAAANTKVLVGDLIKPHDFVMLVTPIDSAAPKGRLILPQQQVLRDVLDHGARAIVVQEDEIAGTLDGLKIKPALVVTDSQAFKKVAAIVPADIPLTSFSILMARYKGFLSTAVQGVKALKDLKEGSRILISEGCTHHRQCGDIGTVKLPAWIRQYTGKDFIFETSSGNSFPEDLSPYDMVIHCGGCMLNEKEMTYRMRHAENAGIPFTNYGTTIAEIHGILDRSIRILQM